MDATHPLSRSAPTIPAGLLVSPQIADFLGDFLDCPVAILNGDEPDYYNKAWRDYAGVSAGIAQHEAWRSVVHAEDHAAFAGAVREARGAMRRVETELRLRRHDGAYRRFEARIGPPPETNGARAAEGRIVVVATDVHDARTLAEENFRHHQELDTHFWFTPLAVVECSTTGRVLDFNPSAERIFGIKREDAVRQDALMLCVAPESREEIGRRFMELVATKRGFRSVNGNQSADGRSIVGEWYNTPILDAEGNVTSVLSSMLDVTEHKRVEEALAESERQYRLLAENSSDVVSLHDLDGRYVYVSPAVKRVTGFDPQELVGTDAYRMIHPDDRDRVRTESHARIVDTGSALIAWRRLRKDGSYFWAETAGQLVRDDAGNPWRLIATTRDISARHAAKQALRESEEAWRALVENSPDYVAKLDADGTVVFVNREPADDGTSIVGRRLPDFVRPEDSDAIALLLRRALETGQAQSIESQFTGCGRPRWFQLRIVPTPREGRPLSNTLIATDVSESRRAAEALRASEEQFRQIAENMREACWVMEVDPPRWTYISPAFEAITGRRNEFVYDDPFAWANIVHADDRHLLPVDETAWRGEMSNDWDREYRIVRADGQVRWIKDRGFPLRGPCGRITRVTGVFEDVTSRKAHEELLVQHAEHLDRLVQQRTGQLRELERQRAEAEKIVATGRMAARIAHEINNPLAGIRNAFELVKDAVPPDHRYYGYVPKITSEIDRISKIVRQMFEAYRPQAERPAHFVLDDCVRDVIALVGPELRRCGVDVVGDLGLGGGRVRLPEHSFRQVLHNLIQNAFEASRPKTLIVVRTRAEDTLQVSVIDGGSGISEGIRSQIFEPFFTTKGHLPRPGLGLGLSVSDGLVRAMGGVIELECPPEGGSHFRISLPRSELTPSEATPTEAAASAPAPSEPTPSDQEGT